MAARARAARFTAGLSPSVGMQLLRNLPSQWIAAHSRRSNLSKSENIWPGEHIRGFKKRITVSDIEVEILKLPAIEQRANWETKTPPRCSCRRFCRLPDFKLKPVSQIAGRMPGGLHFPQSRQWLVVL